MKTMTFETSSWNGEYLNDIDDLIMHGHANTLTDDDYLEMAKWLFRKEMKDYSYTTLTEAKPMILEDYIELSFKDYVENVVVNIDDMLKAWRLMQENF